MSDTSPRTHEGSDDWRRMRSLFCQLARLHSEGKPYRDAEIDTHELLGDAAVIKLAEAAAGRAARIYALDAHQRLDLSQEGLIRLFGKIHDAFETPPEDRSPLLGFRVRRGRGGARFRAWLAAVLLNACKDAARPLRRYSARNAQLSCASEFDRDGNPRQIEPDELPEDELFGRALALLDKDTRKVMRDLRAGKTGVQIAAEMGRSSTWVTRRKQVGIARMRQLLGRDEEREV